MYMHIYVYKYILYNFTYTQTHITYRDTYIFVSLGLFNTYLNNYSRCEIFIQDL